MVKLRRIVNHLCLNFVHINWVFVRFYKKALYAIPKHMQRNQDVNHLSGRDRLVIHDVGSKAGVSTISILLPTASMAPK
jgi:hypothetical protein